MVRVRGRHGEGRAEPRICAFTPQKCVSHGVSRGRVEGKGGLEERFDCSCTPCPAIEVSSEVTRTCTPGTMYTSKVWTRRVRLADGTGCRLASLE
eukprot:5770576-Pleurochrysis_carterae.AAC.2